jgi:hypothetical protein
MAAKGRKPIEYSRLKPLPQEHRRTRRSGPWPRRAASPSDIRGQDGTPPGPSRKSRLLQPLQKNVESTPDAYFQLACSGASGGTHWL